MIEPGTRGRSIMRPSSGSEHGGGETRSNNTMATTDDAPHAPMERLTTRRRRWLVVLGLLRALATAVILVALYYVLPLDRRSDTYVLAEIANGVALLTGVIVWELRAIIRSRYPAIRATQALATT